VLTKIAVVRSSQPLPPSLLCPIFILLLATPAISTSPCLAQKVQKATLRLSDWADLIDSVSNCREERGIRLMKRRIEREEARTPQTISKPIRRI
jgi:hypothetical protein